jgi:hypothetical protein
VASPVECSRCARVLPPRGRSGDHVVARLTAPTAGRPARDHLVAASAHPCSVLKARPRWRGASKTLLARQRQAPCRPGVAFRRQTSRTTRGRTMDKAIATPCAVRTLALEKGRTGGTGYTSRYV